MSRLSHGLRYVVELAEEHLRVEPFLLTDTLPSVAPASYWSCNVNCGLWLKLFLAFET